MIARRLLWNALGFQAVWFGWALGVPAGQLLAPAVVSGLFLLAHFRTSTRRAADAFSVLACVLAGFVFDTTLMQVGWIRFEAPNPAPAALWQPWWMLLLWACLGCTLNVSLAWLRELPRLAWLICAAFGMLAYDAAELMGALSRPSIWQGDAALLLFWAVFVPGVQRLADRFGGAGGALLAPTSTALR